MDCQLNLVVNVNTRFHHLKLVNFVSQVLLNHFHFNPNRVPQVFNILSIAFILTVDHLKCLMDFCDFLSSDVFEIDPPLLCLQLRLLSHLLQLISHHRLMLLQRAHHIIKSPHLRLDHSVDISNVLQSSLF